jgi:hypothetical protein
LHRMFVLSKSNNMTTIQEIAAQFSEIMQPREIDYSKYNVIAAAKHISLQLHIPLDKIIGCRPEDGGLKRWLYTEAGQREKYVELY